MGKHPVSPVKSDSPQKVIGVSGVYRALFIPTGFLPASYPGLPLGVPVLAISLTMEPCLTQVRFLQKTCKDEPEEAQ